MRFWLSSRVHYFGLFSVAGAVVVLISIYQFKQSPAKPATNSSIRSDNTIVQIDPHRPCGAICVGVASTILNRPIPVDQVRRAISFDPLGRTSLAELVRGLRSFGFAAIGVQIGWTDLKRLNGVPIIAYSRLGHFFVLIPQNSMATSLFSTCRRRYARPMRTNFPTSGMELPSSSKVGRRNSKFDLKR